MAAVTALRERARAAVFAAGGRGFVRFLPAGETALLVSDAPRRCGDVPALLDGCRAAGFDARERDGLLLLTPTEAALRALDVPTRIDVDWDCARRADGGVCGVSDAPRGSAADGRRPAPGCGNPAPALAG
ncbi:MAG: hypothetical protein ACLUHE_17995 [Christensenellales bacterium]